MNGHRIITSIAASFLFVSSVLSATEPDPARTSPDAGALPTEWRDKAMLAKSAEVRVREQPDDQAALIDFSVQGIWLHVRQVRGDWLQVEPGWLRAADVVCDDEALDHFTADLTRAESAFAFLCRARAWMLKKDLDKAQADLSEALRLDPQCARVYFVRALIAVEQGEGAKMLENCERAIQLAPRDPVGFEARGAAWFERRELDRALADFDAAIEIFPNYYTARLRRGQVWGMKGDYQKAMADVDEAVRLCPRNPEAYATRAVVLSERRDYEAAIADATKAIELNPSLARGFAIRGGVRFAREEFDLALVDLSEAIRLDPTQDAFYSQRGRAHYLTGQYDAALLDFTQAISLKPGDDTRYKLRAIVWHAKGDTANAIVDLTEYLRFRPDDADAYLMRGRLRLAAESDEALGDFEATLRLVPGNVDALRGRALYWFKKWEFDKALEGLEAALVIDPQSIEARVLRGKARHLKNENQAAIDDFNAVLEREPHNTEALVGRAEAYHGLGATDRAIDDCTSALALNPDYILAFTTRGLARLMRGEKDQAIEDYTAAIRLAPLQTAAWNLRGLARSMHGDLTGAAADFAESLKLNPNQPDIAAELRKLRQPDDGKKDPPRVDVDDFKDWRSRTALGGALRTFEEAASDSKQAAPVDADKLRQVARTAIGGRKFEQAAALLTRALRLADDTSRPAVAHDLAWLLATCPDEKLRDGTRAVELAEEARSARGQADAGLCDTLAAAYAEQGDFAAAIRWQTKAIELLKNQPTLGGLRKRLALYQAGKPYHLP